MTGYEVYRSEDVEYWDTITEEELHEWHEEDLETDRVTPAEEKAGPEWKETPADFEAFVQSLIASGEIRPAV